MEYDSYWYIPGIFGIIFALIYRIPQIMKILKTKKAKDVSSTMFSIQILAYISFITYTAGTSVDVILLIYYITGIIQNGIICLLKKKYDSEITNTNINVPR